MTSLDALTVGTRVCLTRDVDRFPDFLAKKGAVGTVIENTAASDYGFFVVRMDEHIAGAEDWDNEIIVGPDKWQFEADADAFVAVAP